MICGLLSSICKETKNVQPIEYKSFFASVPSRVVGGGGIWLAWRGVGGVGRYVCSRVSPQGWHVCATALPVRSGWQSVQQFFNARQRESIYRARGHGGSIRRAICAIVQLRLWRRAQPISKPIRDPQLFKQRIIYFYIPFHHSF